MSSRKNARKPIRSRRKIVTVGIVGVLCEMVSEHVYSRLIDTCRRLGYQPLHMNRSDSIPATLHQRITDMVAETSVLVLFADGPETGAWNDGALIAFNAAVQQHKPVFVVTDTPPLATAQIRVISASLFGIVSGYWAIPKGTTVPLIEDD